MTNRVTRTTLVALSVIFAAACSDGVPDTPAEAEAEAGGERSPELVPQRFDMESADPIEHGERLSAVLGCIGCHLPDLTGEDWSDPELGILWTANLTQSAAIYPEDELALMITAGTRPDRALMDMPSFLFSELHPDDLAALVTYLKTLPAEGVKHPEPTIGPVLAEEIASGNFKDSARTVAEMKGQAPPYLGPDHDFARFILRATCVECHGMDLRGSTEQLMDVPARPNLRMVGGYSREDFVTLMRTGKALGGRELEMMGGVARWRYSRFTEREVDAVYDYLVELTRSGQ